MKNFLKVLVVTAALTPLVAVLAFMSIGGRISTIETPSMATYAPVGTLVVTEPTMVTDLRVGNAILFTPPGEDRTFFHRIVAITPQGISTRGDLNPDADPWLLHAQNIHGREVLRIASIGWFIKYLPILLLGFLGLTALLRFFIRRGRRLPTFVFGSSVLFTIANLIVRPFSRAAMLSQTVNNAGDTVVNFVVTGVLPLTAKTEDSSVTAVPGQFASITFKAHQAHILSLTPALDNPYLIALVVGVDMLPLLIAIAGRLISRSKHPLTVDETGILDLVPAATLGSLMADLDQLAANRLNFNVFGEESMLDVDKVYRNRVVNIDRMYEGRILTPVA